MPHLFGAVLSNPKFLPSCYPVRAGHSCWSSTSKRLQGFESHRADPRLGSLAAASFVCRCFEGDVVSICGLCSSFLGWTLRNLWQDKGFVSRWNWPSTFRGRARLWYSNTSYSNIQLINGYSWFIYVYLMNIILCPASFAVLSCHLFRELARGFLRLRPFNSVSEKRSFLHPVSLVSKKIKQGFQRITFKKSIVSGSFPVACCVFIQQKKRFCLFQHFFLTFWTLVSGLGIRHSKTAWKSWSKLCFREPPKVGPFEMSAPFSPVITPTKKKQKRTRLDSWPGTDFGCHSVERTPWTPVSKHDLSTLVSWEKWTDTCCFFLIW